MSEALYNRDILRLVSQLNADQDFQTDVSDYTIVEAEKRAKICGSIVTVKVAIDKKFRIKDTVFKVQSCALGQASAALLIEYVQDMDISTTLKMREAVNAILKGFTADITPYPKIEILAIASEYLARHSAIILPYDALLYALETTQKGT